MNRNEQNTSNDTSSKNGPSTIRSEQSSNDAASGKSASSQEPQQGSGIDNASQRDGQRGDTRSDSSSKR